MLELRQVRAAMDRLGRKVKDKHLTKAQAVSRLKKEIRIHHDQDTRDLVKFFKEGWL